MGPTEALSWYFHDPETRIHIRKPALDCPEQFQRLFKMRFNEQFPQRACSEPGVDKHGFSLSPSERFFGR